MKTLLQLFAVLLLATNLTVSAQETNPQPERKTFTFAGGTLGELVTAIKKQLGFDLLEAATIDFKALNNLQVPKMSIPVLQDNWQTVLFTYNEVSRRTEQSLGSWIIQKEYGRPDPASATVAVVFMPPRHLGTQPSFKVKAFSMTKLKAEDFQELRRLIQDQASNLAVTSRDQNRGGDFEGRISYHEGTRLVLASGGQEFVELAATIVEAFKETLSLRREQPAPEEP
jgi:hypothetical protein